MAASVPADCRSGRSAAMFFVMWRLAPGMTLLALGVTPLLALAIRSCGEAMRVRHREWRDLEGQMLSVVQRTLSAIPMVQAFAREEAEHARYRAYADDAVAAYGRATAADMQFKLFVGLVTAAGTAAIMWYGAREALAGRITAGTILVFLAYLASLYAPLNTMIYTASTVQAAAANADRIAEILDTPPDVADAPYAAPATLTGCVRYEHVTFGYEPGRPVLRDVSFEAAPGSVTAIVGATGAGKTTLVNLLVRFFDPWAGRVTVDGCDVRSLRVRNLREQVAVVLQDPFIFPLTVADNIAYGRPAAGRDEIAAAAAAANADEFIRRLPHGYDTVVGEGGATLSGGEKQRLAIARAFLKNAPLLILDEPTSALDVVTESRVLDALDRLVRGRTTFIIAHRLSTVQRADRILVLDRGRLVEQGRHEELLRRGGPYARLHRAHLDPRRPAPPAAAEAAPLPS
jgi:ATP-binding cassette subfamily B protein/subfamily B ATP-binding cassette protein MsbA